MKTLTKNLLICTLFFTQFQVFSQTVDVLTGLEHPIGLAFKGNELFISDQGTDKIFKIDITTSNPIAVDIVNGLFDPYGIAFHGNFLYFSEFSGNRISRIDLSASNPSVDTLLTDVIQPKEIAFYGNELYFTSYNKISKIDVTQVTPVINDILTGISEPSALAFKNEFLYFTSTGNVKLLKIDVTDSTAVPIDVLNSFYITGLTFVDDELYMSNAAADVLSKINVTDLIPTREIVSENIIYPMGLEALNNEVYIAHLFFAEKVSKLNLLTLTTDEIFIPKINAYPNPASSFISLSNFNQNTNYKILDMSGTEVSNGQISADKKIDIKNLSNGLYYIKTEKGDVVKFVKSNEE
ncbi:MAG: T9SS type A sorting domain-containing protein [Bacteroidota bacterium]